MNEENNVLTIKTVQIQPIRNMITAIKDILTDATITFTKEGMKIRNQYVFEKMLDYRIPTVIFMGGGYAKPIEHTIDSFYDLFIDASIWNGRWWNQSI